MILNYCKMRIKTVKYYENIYNIVQVKINCLYDTKQKSIQK